MEKIRKLFSSIKRLQWKLTLGYTLVTVSALFIIELLFFMGLARFAQNQPDIPLAAIRIIREESKVLIPALTEDPPDQNEIREWISQIRSPGGRLYEAEYGSDEDMGIAIPYSLKRSVIVILDDSGIVLASTKSDLIEEDVSIFTSVSTEETALLNRIEDIHVDTNEMFYISEDKKMTIAVPIIDNEEIAGVIFARMAPISFLETLQLGLEAFIPSIVFFFSIAGFIGIFFGMIMARQLSRRLNKLSTAASAWGQGDFSTHIIDNRGDEISDLAHGLNTMSLELQQMMETKQELAAFEERNRLARDLHDSVKQQVFAITMTLGAANALWEENPDQARRELESANQLSRQAQSELSALIHTLRPVELKDMGLVDAMREHINAWEKRSKIPTIFQVEGKGKMFKETEQALFRITQEALSNINKHSHATAASVILHFNTSQLIMEISDNGRGFDTTQENRGMGLHSMRERIQAEGGRMETVSSKNNGTRLIFSMPYQAAKENNND